MNCDDCKDQVLDLIERERVEPDAVRELLLRCPECRALFEETKATLRLAEEIPLEEPPAAVDEAVLRTAREHAEKVVPLTRSRFRPAPWAAAAVALLAVSVGVWSIPEPAPETSEPSSFEAAPTAQSDRAQDERAQDVVDVVDVADVVDEVGAGDAAVREEASKPGGVPESPAPAIAKKSSQRSPSSAMRSSAPRARATKALEADEEAMFGAEDAAFAAEAASPPARGMGGVADRKSESRRSPECERRIADAAAEGDAASGDDALALGRCYLDSKDYAEARRWLEKAAADPKTRTRAQRMLRSLPATVSE